MSKDMLIALDQGTTSTRAIVYDAANMVPLFAEPHEHPQHYPRDGWVEHDVEDIWTGAMRVLGAAASFASDKGGVIRAIGITNQRETVVLWDKDTGKPLHRAIVWQDRRTAPRCEELRKMGVADMVRSRSGLLLDPYFSATKIAWLLKECACEERAARGEVLAGTIDSFLIWRLTGGRKFLTDVTNASRTQLFSLEGMDWDEELLELHGVPRACLPKVMDCADDFGETEMQGGAKVPIRGVAGDQQAAAIGQACLAEGSTKSTYGTGCFMIVQGTDRPIIPGGGLLGTVGYRVGDRTAYAVEGSIFVAGAAVKWLRDSLGLLEDAAQSADVAASAATAGEVYMVPAFTGLGAPHWSAEARGALVGMTLDTDKAVLVRATLESVAYSTNDLLEAFADQGARPGMLNIDGGMSRNDWFAQRLADVTNLRISRPRDIESTASGAAFLAGLSAGLYSSLDEIGSLRAIESTYPPSMADEERDRLVAGWRRAVETVLAHAKGR